MKIPSDLPSREQFYQDVLDACMKSAEDRGRTYNMLQCYYTYGCAPDENESPYNKILPVVDTLTAFLYSADSTRFSAHFGPEVHEDEWDKAPAVSRHFNSEWSATGADLEFQQALDLSTVYGTMIMKWVVKDKHLQPHSVEPHCFGVYREDINGLDRQEAMAHVYYVSKSQLEAELANHPQGAEILAKIAAKPLQTRDTFPEPVRQVIVNGMAGPAGTYGPLSPGQTATGSAQLQWSETNITYRPDIDVEVVEMAELWIWDDSLADGKGDYRTVTMADGRVTIYDRENLFVAKMHPFGQVCPAPRKGYFWGDIIIAKLLALQRKHNVAMARIETFRGKQANPPTELQGYTGAIDEINFALNKEGGVLPLSDPMAKAVQHRIDVPTDLYADVKEIHEMFMEAAALPPLLMGRGETGVRSGRQTSELSRLGSARIKKRALIIEDNLEYFASKGFKAMRKYQDETFLTEPSQEGVPPVKFSLAQVDSELTIKVDGHSNSPLFMEDQAGMAADLLEARAIDRASYIEMRHPPMKDILLRRLKAILRGEAKQAQAQQQAEAAKDAGAGGAKAQGALQQLLGGSRR